MFSYILSCKIRPREFIDQDIFYAGNEKSEIKNKKHESLWSRNSYHSDAITSQQISSTENQHFQNKWNTSTVTDLPTVP